MTETAETVAPLLASRVRKARAESICRRCHSPISVGVPIGKIPGTGWCHLRPCIVGGTAPVTGPHSGA
jgi:hypothetical protein